jgi:hypothetical protein
VEEDLRLAREAFAELGGDVLEQLQDRRVPTEVREPALRLLPLGDLPGGEPSVEDVEVHAAERVVDRVARHDLAQDEVAVSRETCLETGRRIALARGRHAGER